MWLFYFTGPPLSHLGVHGPHNYPLYSVTNSVTNHPGERLIIEKNIQISKLLPLCHLLQCCNYYLDRFLSQISTKCLNDAVFCLAACGHIARPLEPISGERLIIENIYLNSLHIDGLHSSAAPWFIII